MSLNRYYRNEIVIIFDLFIENTSQNSDSNSKFKKLTAIGILVSRASYLIR